MFGEFIFNNAIIEVEKETTDEELEELRKCYPNSKIFSVISNIGFTTK